jgi:hypothetical protein
LAPTGTSSTSSEDLVGPARTHEAARCGARCTSSPHPCSLRASEWRRVDGDKATCVCPAPRQPLSITREAVEKFYRRTLELANKHSPHSWRSCFDHRARRRQGSDRRGAARSRGRHWRRPTTGL